MFRRRAKGRDQAGSGINKCVKIERRDDKRGQSNVNMLQINMFAWPSTVPDRCSLSCIIIKWYSYLLCDIALHSLYVWGLLVNLNLHQLAKQEEAIVWKDSRLELEPG